MALGTGGLPNSGDRAQKSLTYCLCAGFCQGFESGATGFPTGAASDLQLLETQTEPPAPKRLLHTSPASQTISTRLLPAALSPAAFRRQLVYKLSDLPHIHALDLLGEMLGARDCGFKKIGASSILLAPPSQYFFRKKSICP
ncbi:hypothetical protein [Bittarella massiliensis (ex Durand et al. 2017)]|uniref:hypothetical protein n=1 Tax=Bittarella massiliensis (ex Durand et al. 2017) TaxID=1720313 RepID=UPI001AA11D1A|nr:hypothetical protein [Bittarella massiliensis (ex Durand et al. 2017)]MBO1678466.1 hypothetical protein [Bittarella massiliensis (ex Durand et al. 2017)]